MKKSIWSLKVSGLFFCATMGAAGLAFAGDQKFEAKLSGAQEVSAVDTPAMGKLKAEFDKAFTEVKIDLEISNLVGTIAGAHLHCARPGANGSVAFGLMNPGPLSFDGKRISGTLTNADFVGADCVPFVGRPVSNIVALAFAMRDGLVYMNVHSSVYPGGEIRGQLQKKGK